VNKTRPDPTTVNSWHIVGARDEMPIGVPCNSRLLGESIVIVRRNADTVEVAAAGRTLPVLERYGYVWTSFGVPPAELFAIPEYFEADRRNVNAATFGVHVSAPRAIENFLDMGHFPFVHTGYLGEEPFTEVKDYDVEILDDKREILATRCRFYQPRPSPTATEGFDVEYIYRVPHPFCSVLYKSSPTDAARMDVIALFLQPLDEEHVNANMLLSVLDHVNDDGQIRRFQQTIFGQDKPILENQFPKRLPLDPRIETPIRADKSSIAYRRWLRSQGITYGTIPAAAQ
jgi:phenylpropionate dioxygenase-like ring-hydroxylating dioxygenase large terminal subunit